MRILLLFFLVFSIQAKADLKKALWLIQNKKEELSDSNSFRKNGFKEPATSQIFVQQIDHNNSVGVFHQRYWVESRFAKNSLSPTLLYLCGEWTCSPSYLRNLSFYAEQLGAHLVAMEHRYYGESQPFDTLSSKNLFYLTTENALIDFSKIQKSLMKSQNMKGPWIVIGASYSANLAAYYRTLFPDLVVGAWASSGPVKAKEDFEEYDYHVAQVTKGECAEAMRKAVKTAENMLLEPKTKKEVKKMFLAEVLEDDTDFLYLIADMGALAVQYGYLDQFCGIITTRDPLEGYAVFTKSIFAEWGLDALSGSAAGATSLDPNDYQDMAMRQWFYQSCTEYGYWQVAYSDPNVSVRSSKIDLEYHRGICQRLYGLDVLSNAQFMNKKFYFPLLDQNESSNIVFVNGSEDPWLMLSISDVTHNNVNPKNDSVMIEGLSHCDDLKSPKDSDSEELKNFRLFMLTKMKEWVK